jgi:hypothetical protein
MFALKIKSEKKDIFNYIPLPPSFLWLYPIEPEITTFLEKIYLKNYKDLISRSFSQLMLKNEKSLIIFLLKYFMKDCARLMIEEIDLNKIPNLDRSKVQIISAKGIIDKRMGIIDRRIGFKLVSIRGENSRDYIGYITTGSLEDSENPLYEIETSFENVRSSYI